MRTADTATDSGALLALLYVSDMVAPDAGEVARICTQSRVNNLRDDITGLLLFDGKAFCQYVEGPPPAMAGLRERLERDPRHTRMRVLQFGATDGSRRFPSWRLGYAFSADPAAIDRVAGTRGADAIAAFGRWLQELAPVETRGG